MTNICPICEIAVPHGAEHCPQCKSDLKVFDQLVLIKAALEDVTHPARQRTASAEEFEIKENATEVNTMSNSFTRNLLLTLIVINIFVSGLLVFLVVTNTTSEPTKSEQKVFSSLEKEESLIPTLTKVLKLLEVEQAENKKLNEENRKLQQDVLNLSLQVKATQVEKQEQNKLPQNDNREDISKSKPNNQELM